MSESWIDAVPMLFPWTGAGLPDEFPLPPVPR